MAGRFPFQLVTGQMVASAVIIIAEVLNLVVQANGDCVDEKILFGRKFGYKHKF